MNVAHNVRNCGRITIGVEQAAFASPCRRKGHTAVERVHLSSPAGFTEKSCLPAAQIAADWEPQCEPYFKTPLASCGATAQNFSNRSINSRTSRGLEI
jgi:hypothetical protein